MSAFVRALSTASLLALVTLQLPAQGPSASGSNRPITPAEMKRWNSVRSATFTNNGKWFSYLTGLSDSDAVIALREVKPGAQETRINAGSGGGSIAFSGDSKWFGYLSAPPRAAGGRNGRGNPGRGNTPAPAPAPGAAPASAAGWKMVLMNLANGSKQEFDGVRRFAFNTETPTWIVMQGANGGGAAPGGRGTGGGAPVGASGSGGGGDVLLYNMTTGERFNLGRVDQYAFNKDGDWLAYTMNAPDRIGNSVQLRNMANGATRTLENAPVTYSQMSWLDSSRVLGVVRMSVDSAASDTTYSWATFTNFGTDGSAKLRILEPSKASGFPAGWAMTSSAPRYSDDFSMAFFTIREKTKSRAGRGSSLIQPGAPGPGGNGTPAPGATAPGRGTNPAGGTPPAAADTTPSLILWHYKDTRLQSEQILAETADRNATYQAVLRVADNKVVQLTDSTMRGLTVTRGDKLAYGIDTRSYDERASYTGRNFQDVYRVDLATGKRTPLQKGRWPGATSVSPDGKKLMFWGKDANYWVMDIATGDTVNITKGIVANFADMEDDHNVLYRPAAGVRGWSTDGKWVLLSDDWDVWKVSTTPAPASAVNLTGNGKKDQIRYQTLVRWPAANSPNPANGIDLTQPLYFSTYGEWTKKEGLSRVDPGKAGATSIFYEDVKMNISKARDADVFFFTKSSFTEYPDWWTSGPTFANPTRLTDANPQIKELAWSSGSKLINYTTTKGDKLQAAMYLPANFDPKKQYPMLVTIYEKRSQGKNVFVTPSETRAPDPSLYTSRGYIVLDPDIVYKINDPGMSAVWAVIPAVNAAIATGNVDAKHIGLWGHSWGGYQTALLVTQTNMFAAAIAGAPLTNMVSMYGSIYWNSGNANASIFESGQGRFKGNVVENYEAYYRNSPVFFAKNMNTPLIILQNDKDGAVDFNQGVTFYNTLRQLGKPVIFFEYVGENHGLSRAPNQRDYAVRMGEFFDHYLKGVTAPDWLQNGIPRIKMAEHLAARGDSTAIRAPIASAADSSSAARGPGRGGPGGGNR